MRQDQAAGQGKTTMEQTAAILGIILAAGEGTRMKSARPKVLHEVVGLSLLGHAIHAAQAAEVARLGVVIGPERGDVAAEVARHAAKARVFEQRERRGTAHAVLQAAALIEQGCAALVILCGDTPLIRPESIRALTKALEQGNTAVAVLGFEARDATGYGRLLTDGGQLLAIREHKDASPPERAIKLCNAGLMALRGDLALALLRAIGSDNAQNEFYLTDAVALARARGYAARFVLAAEEDAQGVNDRLQLAACEAALQRRLREQHMRAGVTLVAPETVFFSLDTVLERDVVVEPNVVFGPGVRVASGAVIHAFSHLEGASLGAGARVGPFARLRPGADLGAGAKVGNFVEIKQANLGSGAKVSHLTYIGDAEIGAGANIGAGTITCNYDGFAKYTTRIGAGAFIGSNTALVAPVTIGAGAIIGAGSVITADVEADALALTRAPTTALPGGSKAFRQRAETLAKAAGAAKTKR